MILTHWATNAYICQWTTQSFDQVKPCNLVIVKPLLHWLILICNNWAPKNNILQNFCEYTFGLLQFVQASMY